MTDPLLSPGYWSLDALLSWHADAVSTGVGGGGADPAADPHAADPNAARRAILARVVTVELSLRGVRTGELTPPDLRGAPSGPTVSPDSLSQEWAETTRSDGGRIPPPVRVTDLWAQHKYSMMARNPKRGREIGSLLGAQDSSLTFETLLPELVTMLGTPPREGTLRDAVMHMWGYVSPTARDRGLSADFSDLAGTVSRIAEIALEDPKSYLATSTALSDLAAWGNGA